MCAEDVFYGKHFCSSSFAPRTWIRHIHARHKGKYGSSTHIHTSELGLPLELGVCVVGIGGVSAWGARHAGTPEKGEVRQSVQHFINRIMIKPYMVEMLTSRIYSPTEPDRFENPDVVEEI